MATPIEDQINVVINKWMQQIELMLRNILAKKGVFHPDKANLRVEHVQDTNIRNYYIEDELVLTADIVTEKRKIIFKIEPAERYKDV